EKSGKSEQIDPATGERIIDTIVDYLPENWRAHAAGDAPIDSLGRPIVNTTPGLPGWAQADVDALRNAIAEWITVRIGDIAAGRDPAETDGILGNFIGQAITRGLAFDDLVSLDDGSLISDTTTRSIISYLHFYESVKFLHAQGNDY